MKKIIDIVKDIADGMIGIGGIPSNEEHYEAWGSPGSNTASMEGLTWTIKK